MANLRQKKVAKILMEGNGTSVSQAMKEAGYPDTTASNPQQLTRSKGWKELMDQYLPDDLLLKVHEEGLQAKKPITDKGIITDEYPDYDARSKYLGLGYKIKSKIVDKTDLTSGGKPLTSLLGDDTD